MTLYFYNHWPKQIEVPRDGELTIYGSGGFGGVSGPAVSTSLAALTDEEFEAAKALVHEFLNMDLSGFSMGMDVDSHNLQVGDDSFEAYPIWIPGIDSQHCPKQIRDLYEFIEDPASFISRKATPTPSQAGTPPRGFTP